jgi:hypothetical protein
MEQQGERNSVLIVIASGGAEIINGGVNGTAERKEL